MKNPRPNRDTLRLHPRDDLLVALADLSAGTRIDDSGREFILLDAIPAKHKFSARALSRNTTVRLYNVVIGRAASDLAAGVQITPERIAPVKTDVPAPPSREQWIPPDYGPWRQASFAGYLRRDGRAATANIWLLIPLVFCENRNLEMMWQALTGELGYSASRPYRAVIRRLLDNREADPAVPETGQAPEPRLFPNIDGIKFLKHSGGCGGTPRDAVELCGLLAGYITHPNCAGATVLSLGCQHATIAALEREIERRCPGFNRPLFIYEQQKSVSERDMLAVALKQSLEGMRLADRSRRQPVPLQKLVLGVECGGSDGFSGISANPAMGAACDIVVAAGGSVILGEFPELSGMESEIVRRCVSDEAAGRFMKIMRDYNALARMLDTGFGQNPSQGNIGDGLFNIAVKSAGAARKGGTSPVVDVLDYPQWVQRPGLNLLNTPGHDVESTTALAGAGANVILFSTGLGTPTGNALVPVIKISSNSELCQRMPDIIDIDAGTVISGIETPESVGKRILDFTLEVASGLTTPRAVALGQDDFIPWKRSVSL